MSVERSFGVAAGVTLGIAILYYLYGPRLQDALTRNDSPPPPAEEAPAPAPARVPEPAAQAPEYPVPETPPVAAPAAPQAKAPPVAVAPDQDLVVSDASVRSGIASVFGAQPVESFLIPERVIQNIVTTIDSLDREPVPLRFRAIVDVPEVMAVERKDNGITLAAKNAERYRPLMLAMQAADANAIAALYLRYYPLLQRAYREAGYPDAYFNDRVVHVIDHLLAAPEVEGPIELQQPKVLYTFADPRLEALSSGQKVMVRIGLANESAVKDKLRAIRAIIASRRAPPR